MNWEYISGFFDADGCISLIKPSKLQHKTLYIMYANNERRLLEEMKEFIDAEIDGKGAIICKKSKNANHNDAYELRYSHNAGIRVLQKMNIRHPKKFNKAQIAKRIGEGIQRNGRYSPEELIIKKELEEAFASCL